MMNLGISNKYLIKIFFFIFITTLICSGASPFVNLVKEDQAIFYAIGKCIAKGQVLYRDALDHKGSYIFFLNAIAYIISSLFPFQNFLGLYLLEFFSMLFMAFYLFRIFKLYLNETLSFYAMMSFFAIYYYRGLFRFGNRCETWVLTMQIISIYYILMDLKSLKDNDFKGIKFRHYLLHGIFVGIVFNIKMNYIAMWGALIFFFIYLLIHKEYLLCFKNVVLAFLLGFIVANIPMLIYCLINNSFHEMFFWSIYLNFAYVNMNNLSFIQRFYLTVSNINYMPIYIIILVSILYIMLSKIDIKIKVLFMLLFLFSMFVVAYSYIGINFFHYNIYMLPFMIPFFVLLFSLIHKYIKSSDHNVFQGLYIFIIILFVILVNKKLGRSKPILTETENNVIESIREDYTKNNNLNVFASGNEVYYAYCYTDAMPKKGIVVCSMFLSVVDDIFYNKLYSLLNDNYDYVVLYNDFMSKSFDDKWGLSTKIKQMLEKKYTIITSDVMTRCYKKTNS